jgi:hypothetical protein
VAALLLDAHRHPEVGTTLGHAALGGASDELNLAIFGSHTLQSHPSCVWRRWVPAFINCTRTDTKFEANVCNDCGISLEAATIRIGAHLHEVGHLLDCPIKSPES